jgi:glycosyltransferase involved in cell wall biosynthesis
MGNQNNRRTCKKNAAYTVICPGSTMDASIIITTYNWPEALRVTLDSLRNQSIRSMEIIVADDGSGPATAQVVKEILAPSNLKWIHVRHNDSGIRQARVKNLGVKYSHNPYLIFIDHDVALHTDFIADHLARAEQGYFLQGKRAFLPQDYTDHILRKNTFSPPSPFLPGIKNRKNMFRLPCLGTVVSWSKKFQTSLRGCNLSMHKGDFVKVDGYDETFDQLWGREDSDICYRLFNLGLRIKNLWFSALQYHLNHKAIKRSRKDRLDFELIRVRREKRCTAMYGFSRLTSEGGIVAASD